MEKKPPIDVQGGCLCGAVKVRATASPHMGACHCTMCRTWSGGPYMALDAGETARFEGEESIAVFKSSAWAERGFCRTCGTHLFYRVQQSGQTLLPPGLVDDHDARLTFDHQVFIDKKPDLYSFANETVDMTEADIFAKFGGG